MNLIDHIHRQMKFSATAFGPGTRLDGVCDHIRKEMIELGTTSDLETELWKTTGMFAYPKAVQSIMQDRAMRRGEAEEPGDPKEWVDVALLALDGLWRALRNEYSELTDREIATLAAEMIEAKLSKNEKRDWPDWRDVPEGKAIEHIKGSAA